MAYRQVDLAGQHVAQLVQTEGGFVRNDQGTYVPLGELPDLTAVTGRYMVLHDGARRRQAVTCNVEGRDLSGFVREAKEIVAKLKLPSETYAEFGGAAEAQAAARNELLLHSTFASWR